MKTLTILRKQLDQVDAQILALLNRRTAVVEQIGLVKQEQQLALQDAQRESLILKRLQNLAHHPLLKESLAELYTVIFKFSKTAQKLKQATPLPFQNIAIIGLGLLGGSICKAIKLHHPHITISTTLHRSPDYEQAMLEGWIDSSCSSLKELLQQAELIILASPIGTIIPIAQQIHRELPYRDKKLLVMDIASVKGAIAQTFENLGRSALEFIATHPMAGCEHQGFAHSQASLFVNHPWIITPHRHNASATLEQISTFVQQLGAIPHYLEASEHDKQTALISHLPGIIAKSFFDFIQKLHPHSLCLCGPGFHSFTRLAHDNSQLRREIAQYNEKAIKKYLSQWLGYLTKQQEG